MANQNDFSRRRPVDRLAEQPAGFRRLRAGTFAARRALLGPSGHDNVSGRIGRTREFFPIAQPDRVIKSVRIRFIKHGRLLWAQMKILRHRTKLLRLTILKRLPGRWTILTFFRWPAEGASRRPAVRSAIVWRLAES